MIKKLLNRLPNSLKWTPHNLFGHPASEIMYILSLIYSSKKFEIISNKIHDNTIPDHEPGEGRG